MHLFKLRKSVTNLKPRLVPSALRGLANTNIGEENVEPGLGTMKFFSSISVTNSLSCGNMCTGMRYFIGAGYMPSFK